MVSMSDFSRDDILKLAALARLSLTDEELARYQKELSSILDYVEKLQAADTEGLQPTYQVTGLQNVTRADEEIDYGASQKALLKNAPATEKNMFKVKRMVG